jgi:hypothetical protein
LTLCELACYHQSCSRASGSGHESDAVRLGLLKLTASLFRKLSSPAWEG